MRRLAVLGVLAAAVALLAAFGALPRWPGLAMLVALPPLDLFTDLRVLVAVAPSYPALLGGLVAVVLARSALLATLLGGPWGASFAFALRTYLVVLPVALLAGLSTWIAHAGLYARLHWVGQALALLTLVVVAPALWSGARTLRAVLAEGWRAGFRLWPLLGYAAVHTGIAAAAAPLGPAGWIVAVLAAVPIVLGAIASLERPASQRPFAHAGSALAVLAVAGIAFVTATSEEPPPPAEVARAGSLLAMSGMNSESGNGAALEIDYPEVLGYPCEQVYYFSYAGPGDGQPQRNAACPIRTGAPYVADDTRLVPFEQQVRHLADQVEGLPAPVTLIAHSQGAWVAWQAAADGLLVGVERLVVIGPFPDGPLGFPALGERGPGLLGAELLRAAEPMIAMIGFHFHPDEPLVRDILARADAPRRIYSRHLPDGLDALSIVGIGDLAITPGRWRLDGATNGCPVITNHPDLPHAPGVQRQIRAFLDDEELPRCPRWRILPHALSMPWAPPPEHGEDAYRW